MKKSLISLFALAFTLMFGMVHVANAMKHMAPAAGEAPAADAKMDEKKEVKKEKKKAKKKAMKKDEKKEAATPATPATPAAPAAPAK